MKKMLRKGFTLVELLVVLILMGVITTAVVMVLRPANRVYNKINNKAGIENSSIVITDYINGKLRYSTAVSVVINDGAFPTPGIYKHYIMLSNKAETSRQKNAMAPRGHIRAGNTADYNTNKSGSFNDNVLDNYDFQFSVPGYTDAAGQESLSIQIEGSAVIRDPVTDTFAPDTDNHYVFTETFEMVNMQHTTGKVSTGLSVQTCTDYTDKVIWILYQDPEEADDLDPGTTTTTTTTQPVPTPTPEVPETPEAPDPNAFDPADCGKVIVHIIGASNENVIKTAILDAYDHDQVDADYPDAQSGEVNVDQFVYTPTRTTTSTFEFVDDGDTPPGQGVVTIECRKPDNTAAYQRTVTALEMHNCSDLELWIYNGVEYASEADALAQKDLDDNPPAPAQADTYGKVFLHYIGAADNSAGNYVVNCWNGVTISGDLGTGWSSFPSTDTKNAVVEFDNDGAFLDLSGAYTQQVNGAYMKNRTDMHIYIYKGNYYDSDQAARDAKQAEIDAQQQQQQQQTTPTGESTYGTGAPTPVDGQFTLAIDVPSDKMQKYLYVNAYNATECIIVHEATGEVVGSTNQQEHFDISKYSGDTRFILVCKVPYTIQLKVGVWANQWQNAGNPEYQIDVGSNSYGTSDVFTKQ